MDQTNPKLAYEPPHLEALPLLQSEHLLLSFSGEAIFEEFEEGDEI